MKLIDLEKINFVEKKKENNMNNSRTEAIRELCHIITYEADRSPLRWTDVRDDSAEVKYANTYGCNSIYIYNNNSTDKVCKVRVYENSLRCCSPNNMYYYVYFTDKYSSVAIDIASFYTDLKDPRIAGITEAEGYKFVYPRHVVDFVREVVRLKERGGVLKDCKTEKEPIAMKDLPTDIYTYSKADVLATEEFYKYREYGIVDVIFNDPATIIIWADGSKTVVKAENEPFDPEKGLAMAISKKVLGNKYDYYDVFKKYVGRYEKKQKKGKK